MTLFIYTAVITQWALIDNKTILILTINFPRIVSVKRCKIKKNNNLLVQYEIEYNRIFKTDSITIKRLQV